MDTSPTRLLSTMADQEYVQNHEERGEDRDDSDEFPPSAEPSRAITAFDPTQAQSPHQRKARGRTLGPLWDNFHVGDRKNPSHMWAVCRACATNVAGTKQSMAAHVRNCREMSAEDKTSFLERADVKTALTTTRTGAPLVRADRKRKSNDPSLLKELSMVADISPAALYRELQVAYPFFLLAGPNVIQSLEHTVFMARNIKAIAEDLGLPYVFKASYDKANRTSSSSFRGPGLEEGLEILSALKRQVAGIRILADVHEANQCDRVSEVADILQIPAFLCRQTDLIQSAARTGKVIHIKKGQFCGPEVMTSAAEKVRAAGNPLVIVCERGTTFGYHDLILDPRNLVWMRSSACPVTDSGAICSGGLRDLIPTIGRTCVAVGVDGIFMETHLKKADVNFGRILMSIGSYLVHDNPLAAPVDGATQWPLRHLRELLEEFVQIAVRKMGSNGFSRRN